jgi:hypothetical protein
VFLPEQDFYRAGGWKDKAFYELVKERYPNAFKEHERRVEIGQRVARERGVNLKPIVEPDGNVYQQLKIKVKTDSPRELIGSIIKAEEIFLEVYSRIEGKPIEKFKIPWKNHKIGTDQLLKTYNYTYQIINETPQTIEIESVIMENPSYLGYTKTSLYLRAVNETRINLYIEYSTKPKENRLYITIKSKDNGKTILKQLEKHKPKTHDNTITIEKTNLDNIDTIKHIKQIIKNLTKKTKINRLYIHLSIKKLIILSIYFILCWKDIYI